MRGVRPFVISMLLGIAVWAVPATAGAETACPKHPAKFAGRHVTLRPNDDSQLACADLRHAVLDGLDLVQFDLHDADLTDASLREAKLIQADLTGAKLDRANFTGAELGQAYLDHTHATGAIFDAADVTQMHLRNADASGASFIGAEAGQMEAQNADLSNANFTAAELSQADLRGADVHGATFVGADTTELLRAPTDPPIGPDAPPTLSLPVASPQADPVEPSGTSNDLVWVISSIGILIAVCSALMARGVQRRARRSRRAATAGWEPTATFDTAATPLAASWEPDPDNPAYHVVDEGRRGLFRRR